MGAELAQPGLVHYIPILTTLMAIGFLIVMARHYIYRTRKPHILWWTIGIFTYGLGTGLESAITVFGNSVELNKTWYVAGAILGGYPLAQGSVYLHLKRKTADRLTAVSLMVIIVTSALVLLSPVNLAALEIHRPTGAILEWQWVRLMTPIINIYAVIFLIGGAIYSACKFYKERSSFNRVIGNSMIAFGAILPGIGGTMAKAGIVEALYIGEFVGLIFIWWGYRYCLKPTPAGLAQAAAT